MGRGIREGRDPARLEHLRVDLAAYRLAFGQPRQQDMVELVRRHGAAEATIADPVDLRPDPVGEWPSPPGEPID